MINVIGLTAVDDKPMLKGAVRYAVESGGESIASGELLAHSWLGDETGEFVRQHPLARSSTSG